VGRGMCDYNDNTQPIDATQQIVPTRPAGWHPMIIVYRIPMCYTDSLMQSVMGVKHCEFTHCETYLPDESGTFTIFMGGSMIEDKALPVMYKTRPHLFAWHMVPLNDAEYTGMLNWNRLQIAKHCPYNFRDLMWQITPGIIRRSCVKDIGVSRSHNPTRMFCSQSIILALREASAMPGARPMLAKFASSCNSRILTPSDLSRMTTEYLRMPVNHSEVPTTTVDVYKHLSGVVNYMGYSMQYNPPLRYT
jgi:hypothetical protein